MLYTQCQKYADAMHRVYNLVLSPDEIRKKSVVEVTKY